MAGGNKPLKKKEGIVTPAKLHCLCCNNEFKSDDFYDSDSELHESIGKIPYCKECLNRFYKHYYKLYKDKEYFNPDRRAMERICMMLDIYYSDKVFDSAIKLSQNESSADASFVSLYFRRVKLYQYRNKNYDTTINEKHKEEKEKQIAATVEVEDTDRKKDIEMAIQLFGKGFSNDDYLFLYENYADWTTRNECNTKSQETVFKNICLTELKLLKANRNGEETKDLDKQLRDWLDSGKLQPKQNSGDTVSDAQTFGTLIDKWEHERPIPEISEELKDVDNISKYIDVFYKGGLARSLNLDIEYSQTYDEYMRQYTVSKPEYDDEVVNGVSREIHEAIFGSNLEDSDVGE